MRSRVFLVLLAVVLSVTCRREEKPSAVILISVDTLRSDHLPAYGYRGIATPALDAFRKDAVLFQRAWSHSPLTLPSHATILTGLLPAEHGVRDNTGFRVSPKTPTIASILRAHGYATAAAVSAYILRSATGINNGFDVYDDEIERGAQEKALGAVQRRGVETTAIAQQWIGAHGQKPFFYFLHLYEPHAPYDPPEPFFSRYPSKYDGEIAYTDSIVGGFLDFLKQQDIYDRALIVFLSDHGEGLGDHGEEEHGIFLYRESISVPMMIKLPANARRRDDQRRRRARRRHPDDPQHPRARRRIEARRHSTPVRGENPASGDLQRDVLSAFSFRVERSALARRWRRAFHRRTARRALRHQE